MIKRSIIAVLTGLAVFAVSAFAVSTFIPDDVFVKQVGLKFILAVVSVAAGIWLFGLQGSEFKIGKGVGKSTRRYVLFAFLLGIAATAIVLLFRLPPIPLIRDLSLGQYFIAVWLVSSICEEVFARGLVQGIVHKYEAEAGRQRAIPVSVWAGAITFSLIHFSIYVSGGSILTCLTIMFFTLLLGLMAGLAKTKGNLLSAIYVHISFNVGGFIGGIIVNIIYKVATGEFLVQ